MTSSTPLNLEKLAHQGYNIRKYKQISNQLRPEYLKKAFERRPHGLMFIDGRASVNVNINNTPHTQFFMIAGQLMLSWGFDEEPNLLIYDPFKRVKEEETRVSFNFFGTKATLLEEGSFLDLNFYEPALKSPTSLNRSNLVEVINAQSDNIRRYREVSEELNKQGFKESRSVQIATKLKTPFYYLPYAKEKVENLITTHDV